MGDAVGHLNWSSNRLKEAIGQDQFTEVFLLAAFAHREAFKQSVLLGFAWFVLFHSFSFAVFVWRTVVGMVNPF